MDRWLATMSEKSKLQQWLFWHNNIYCLILQTLRVLPTNETCVSYSSMSKIDSASPKKAAPTAPGRRYIHI